jgi:hypothetical protein
MLLKDFFRVSSWIVTCVDTKQSTNKHETKTHENKLMGQPLSRAAYPTVNSLAELFSRDGIKRFRRRRPNETLNNYPWFVNAHYVEGVFLAAPSR